MKRDINLIREILINAEDTGTKKDYVPNISGYSSDTLDCHVKLMGEAGLVQRSNVPFVYNEGLRNTFDSITWKGSEFLNLSRNQDIWDDMLNEFEAKGIGHNFELVLEFLTKKNSNALLVEASKIVDYGKL